MSSSQPPTMPPPPPAPIRPLTLIVATTPVLRHASKSSTIPPSSRESTHLLGIGLNGTLPWPRIKSDMTFFARVTTRPPTGTDTTAAATTTTTNAIIMGRKTYESLPKHLRPLGKRINVVITRDTEGKVKKGILEELEGQKLKKQKKKQEQEQEQEQQNGCAGNKPEPEPEPITDAIVCTSLESALESLHEQKTQKRLGNIFVIGGGEIYASALRLPPDSPYGRGLRIVMTKVKKKKKTTTTTTTNTDEDASAQAFECDTIFPLDEDDLSPQRGWREVSAEELSGWVGESVSSDWKDDGDVSIKIVGYERIS